MRSYMQFCPAAKALDVIGDRWSLLIMRELLTRGACRYTDLQDGLPGIASNLLAGRLRELQRAGVVKKEKPSPRLSTTLFKATPRGEELAPVLEALGEWGAPRLAAATDDDHFRSHWLVLPLRLRLRDHHPDRAPASIEIRTGDQPLVIDVGGGVLEIRPGTARAPDTVITGQPRLVLGLLVGALSLADAGALGLECAGDREVLARVQHPSRAGSM